MIKQEKSGGGRRRKKGEEEEEEEERERQEEGKERLRSRLGVECDQGSRDEITAMKDGDVQR